MTLTPKQLSSIARYLKEPKLTIFCNAINSAMEGFDISNLDDQADFIAQIMHESGECKYVKELASGAAYEGRKDLGNTEPGDGIRYKGRGLIQITGRANYRELSDYFDVDFISNPELLEQPEYAAKSAAWFWRSRGLSELEAINTEGGFLKESIRINGRNRKTGLPNGWEDRQKYRALARKQLGLD